ncbi:MAG: EAL domain-containing protein [Rhodanobacter sp.]
MNALPTVRLAKSRASASVSTRQWQMVTQLFVAADAAAVTRTCSRMLRHLGISGRVRWIGGDQVGTDAAATQLVLADDVLQAGKLIFEPDSVAMAEKARSNEHFTWIGKLASTRLRQLAENDEADNAASRAKANADLQQALYAISAQATTDQPIPTLLGALHNLIKGVMYAESLYVVLYNAGTESVRFPYYVDDTDKDPPVLNEDLPASAALPNIARNLLRSGEPMVGAKPEAALSGDTAARPHDQRCEHWLGAPLLRDGSVVGAVVTVSYRAGMGYTRREMDLLVYVAQHVQSTLERHTVRQELSRRVGERTVALRETNRILRQQVLQRQRGERLQAALFRIAELADSPESPESFYVAMHQVISGLLYARNIQVALVDDESGSLTFPYFVDQKESRPQVRAHGRGLSEYVLRHGTPMLASPTDTERLREQGEISQANTGFMSWLGVPLTFAEKPIGVLALQSYSQRHIYTEMDQELLTFVGYHIANALQRKHAAASLKQAYAGLERRVTERTRALALANNDLRAQIVERERIERRLKYETLHDSLTGLPNRSLLLQRLDDAMARYLLNRKDQFAVLFIDLDRFKVINDSVGHLVGDDLLFQVGGRIRACLKTRDMVARLGGDEFAVLLDGIDRGEDARVVAERIIHELQAPFQLGLKEIFTSASIGIALPGKHYRQPEELLRDADAAMYSAKDAGRHRCVLFDDHLRREALSLLDMENDLRHGLARGEFEPFYQPIVELDTGLVLGYEALLRWHHPQRGLLQPGDFLPIAEESGCSETIDWQIFEQACAQGSSLITDDGFISINVSSRHFRSVDFDQRLLALFERYAVPARCMRVEVTEHTLLENSEQVKKILQNLRQHGVGIVLDDFGTGYSSLSYLHQYPFETLKIDRSFITELPLHDEQTQGLALVRTIQVLADSLHMRVIAEGIEQESQRHALLGIGCRFGQGFLFAKGEAAAHWQSIKAPFHLP